ILPFALGLMLAVAVTVVVDRRDGGWFLYYMFGIAIAHQIKWSYLLLFWTRDMFTTVPIAMVLGGVVLLPAVVPARRRYAYLAVAAGLLALSWRARMNVGGYLNSLMPAFALLSLLFGIGWHAVRAEQADEAPSARRATAPWLTLAVLAQLAFLVTNPRSVLPSAADRAAGNTLVSALAADAGEVWVPAHPYLTRLAGKTPFAHEMAISDVLLDPGSEATRELRASVERALAEHRFTAIVLDGESLVRRDVERCYAPATPVFTDPGVFWPATGWRTRPATVYLPRAACS
ncbi:MAG TPA: hypothetical protein VGQ33_08105, partial [Vicinamibacteria bacterium]|nr:hypothetical protein [Vicinamibacteria bacterium]